MALQKISIDVRTALEVASHEAIVLETYKDSEGILTVFVGLTKASGIDPKKYLGKPATMAEGLAAFIDRLDGPYKKAVLEAFEGYTLKPHEFAAALSFHWNTGAIKKATWVKDVKRGDMVAAKKNFMRYRIPASIINRRTKERDLFFDGTWSNNGKIGWYKKVKPTLSPDWSSRVNIDVTKELTDILGGVPVTPKPLPEPAIPDPKPEPKPEAKALTFWQRLVAFFTGE